MGSGKEGGLLGFVLYEVVLGRCLVEGGFQTPRRPLILKPPFTVLEAGLDAEEEEEKEDSVRVFGEGVEVKENAVEAGGEASFREEEDPSRPRRRRSLRFLRRHLFWSLRKTKSLYLSGDVRRKKHLQN